MEQTLSALSVVQQIPQETKHRDISNASGSTSNNRSQAQVFHIPDLLVNSPSCNSQSSNQNLSPQCNTPLFIMELVWRNFTISPMVLEHSAVTRFLLVSRTRKLKFLEYTFLLKCRQIVAKNVTKFLQALNLQRSHKRRI